MPRTYRWLMGGMVGLEENESGVAWTVGTGALPYTGCPVIYRAHHTAGGQNFKLVALKNAGNDVNFLSGAFADRTCIEGYIRLSDSTPAGAFGILATAYTANAGDSAKLPTWIEYQTNADIKVWANDLSTLLATFASGVTTDTWYAFRMTHEKMSSTRMRWRFWIVLADGRPWGDPLQTIDDSTFNSSGHSGSKGGTLYSFDAVKNVDPQVDHDFASACCYDFTDDADLHPVPARLFRADPIGTSANPPNNNQFTGGPAGPTHPAHTNVNDAVTAVPDDTNYDADVSGSAADQTYDMTAWPYPWWRPECVQIYSRIHRSTGSGAVVNARALMSEGGTDALPSDTFNTGAWRNCGIMHNTPPTTGGIWTPAKFDTVEAGAKRTNSVVGGTDVRISRTEAIGLYLPASLVVPNRAAIRTLIAR